MEVFANNKDHFTIVCIKGYQANNILMINLHEQTNTQIYDQVVNYLKTSTDYSINPGMVINPKLEILYDHMELKNEYIDKYNLVTNLFDKFVRLSNDHIDMMVKMSNPDTQEPVLNSIDIEQLGIKKISYNDYKNFYTIPISWYKEIKYSSVEFILDVNSNTELYKYLSSNNLMTMVNIN